MIEVGAIRGNSYDTLLGCITRRTKKKHSAVQRNILYPLVEASNLMPHQCVAKLRLGSYVDCLRSTAEASIILANDRGTVWIRQSMEEEWCGCIHARDAIVVKHNDIGTRVMTQTM